MTLPADIDRALEALRQAVRGLPREAAPELAGALSALAAEAILAATPPTVPGPAPDRALSLKEASRLIGRSPDWIQRHRHELPITRLPSGRYVIRERKLAAWLERRTA
jgi:hypothetical protein